MSCGEWIVINVFVANCCHLANRLYTLIRGPSRLANVNVNKLDIFYGIVLIPLVCLSFRCTGRGGEGRGGEEEEEEEKNEKKEEKKEEEKTIN